MAISVENFMKREQEKGRSSKLEPFKKDILALKQNGFSQKQIQQFLAENGLTVGLTTINWFLRTRSKSTDFSVTKSQEYSETVNKLNREAVVPSTHKPPTKKKGNFNWQEEIPESEMF